MCVYELHELSENLSYNKPIGSVIQTEFCPFLTKPRSKSPSVCPTLLPKSNLSWNFTEA